MQTAVAPNYLKRREKVEIDLNAIPDKPDDAFWKTAMDAIDRKMEQLYALRPAPDRTLRISVFALAPIPLLIYLGSKLSDKIEVDLYQRHRDGTWLWKDGNGEARYTTRCLVQGEQSESVALLINLSGQNNLEALPKNLGERITVYELILEGEEFTPLHLNTRSDLERFKVEFIRARALIRQAYPNLNLIHLFPAVPAPVAILLGQHRLPKVDAPLRVYDRDKRAGGFVPTLEVK